MKFYLLIFCTFVISVITVSGLVSSWSADDVADQEEWDVVWDVPEEPDIPEGSGSHDHEYEILDLTFNSDKEETNIWRKYRFIFLFPLSVLFCVVVVTTCWSIYKGRCCISNCCRNYGRKVVNTYVPGIKIHKDNTVDYYQITEEEIQAIEGVTDAIGLFDDQGAADKDSPSESD